MSLSLKSFGFLAAGLLLASATVVTAQDKPKSTLQGNIQIDGSSTVKPIGEAVANRFSKLHPGVKVDVGGRGTGNGFKRFQSKETDISEASRPIKSTEFKKVKGAGIEFLELPVAYDGLTIVIHPDNDWVKKLTVDQLKKIFVGTGAKTWKDVDPSWPAEEIKLFAPGTGSGTYDYFKEVVVEDGEELRTDMSLNEDDNALVTGVAGNKYSLGFFGVAYYAENTDKLKAVAIVNPKGEATLPEPQHIESGAYAPFSRPLFIYVNKESMNRAEMQVFVDFYIQQVTDTDLLANVGYVKLPEEIMESAFELLDDPDVSTGTVFVDKSGESVKGKLADRFKSENRVK